MVRSKHRGATRSPCCKPVVELTNFVPVKSEDCALYACLSTRNITGYFARTCSYTRSRLRILKAFLISILTIVLLHSGLIFLRSTYARSDAQRLWIFVSTPTPIYFGLRCSASLEVTWRALNRPVILRYTLPTALGRTPQSGFLKATNNALNIAPGQTIGFLPLGYRLANFVITPRALRPSSSS